MKTADTIFAVPTYRLRDVGATIEEYDANFWSNGHSVKMVIFDDSSLANHEKYYSELEKTRTVNDLYYVGPQEKEQFLKFLNRKLHDRKLESLVRTIFRPSYGGNRNFSLIYTLGAFLVSADDDMRPYALVESSPESLKPEEVSRGRLKKPGENGYIDKSFDILTSFKDVLGKKVSELPGNFESGNLLVDTSMDLETNVTKEFATENSLLLEDGPVSKNAVVKIAQSFRTGTNDIDALDYVEMYLHDEDQRQKDLHEINEVYVLENFRPVVTNKNWRIDCGVAGYDNRLGLPSFFPTRLRFEDYIYRLWIQQDGIVAAHTDAVRFEYEGEVTLRDSEEILQRITAVHTRVLDAAASTKIPERKEALLLFAENLARSFYGFEPDFFQQNVSRIVDDVVSQIHATLEIWPTLIEICYFHKDKREFPQRKVQNKRIKRRSGAN